MIDHNGHWLPSVSWGIPAIALGLMVSLALLIAAIRFADDFEDALVLGCLPAIAVLALIIAPLFAFYPYGGDYHRLQPATGTVRAVDSRFLAASQYVVITYDTGLIVRCDDSRCATVKLGDQLRLLCTKEHQFGSPLAADGWGCRWGEHG